MNIMLKYNVVVADEIPEPKVTPFSFQNVELPKEQEENEDKVFLVTPFQMDHDPDWGTASFCDGIPHRGVCQSEDEYRLMRIDQKSYEKMKKMYADRGDCFDYEDMALAAGVGALVGVAIYLIIKNQPNQSLSIYTQVGW